MKQYIIKGELNNVQKELYSSDPSIKDYDYDDYNDFLSSLLNICVKMGFEENKKETFKLIVEIFDFQDDFIPLYSKLWSLRRMTLDTLNFMKEVYNYTYELYIIDYSNYQTFPEDKESVVSIGIILDRLEKVFGKPNGDTLIKIRNILSSNENVGKYVNANVKSYIENSLLSYQGNEIKIAPKPEYVEDFGYGEEDDDLLEQAFTLILETELLGERGYEIAKKLALEIPDEDINIRGNEFEKMNMRDFVYRNMVTSFPEELHNSLNTKNFPCQITNKFYFDPDDLEDRQAKATFIFQILGPQNPFGDLEYGYDEKNIYDRMFTCVCYENGLEEDYRERDDRDATDTLLWFTGICDYCTRKITNYHYSVRCPVIPGGGFTGCYCSWKCVKKDLPVLTPDMESYINKFEKQMIEYGIHYTE